MTQAAVQPSFSFEADIDFRAQTDARSALVRGTLVKMTNQDDSANLDAHEAGSLC